MKHLLLCIALIVGFSASVQAQTKEDQEISTLKVCYPELTQIKHVFYISVELQGTAKDIGFDYKDIRDYVTLKARKSFIDIDFTDLPRGNNGVALAVNDPREWGMMMVTVWTVGDKWPVSYYVRVKIAPYQNGQELAEERLGYDTAIHLNAGHAAKDVLSDAIDDVAIKLMKMRAKPTSP